MNMPDAINMIRVHIYDSVLNRNILAYTAMVVDNDVLISVVDGNINPFDYPAELSDVLYVLTDKMNKDFDSQKIHIYFDMTRMKCGKSDTLNASDIKVKRLDYDKNSDYIDAYSCENVDFANLPEKIKEKLIIIHGLYGL